MNTTSEDEQLLLLNSNFTISNEIHGPTIATVFSIQMILTVITNSLLLTITYCHNGIKSLKQPSIIFLNSLMFYNLILALLFMPFTIVTAATGQWLINQPIHVKGAMCKFVGLIFAITVGLSVHILAVISFDRFLYIVKPLLYKRYMGTKLALFVVILVTLLGIILALTPLFGLGRYGFSSSVASCLPIWVDELPYVIYTALIGSVVFIIIIITSIWTFCFTRNFIRSDHERTLNYVTSTQTEASKHVYNVRIRNLIGVFGALLLVYLVTFSPYLLVTIIGFIVGFDLVPPPLYATVLIFYLLNAILSPIVQAYFRRDIKEAISSVCGRLGRLFGCHGNNHQENESNKEKSASGQSGNDGDFRMSTVTTTSTVSHNVTTGL